MTITGSSLKYCHHDIAIYPEQGIFYFCTKSYQKLSIYKVGSNVCRMLQSTSVVKP